MLMEILKAVGGKFGNLLRAESVVFFDVLGCIDLRAKNFVYLDS